MKNRRSPFLWLRWILAGIVLLLTGTSFTTPVSEARNSFLQPASADQTDVNILLVSPDPAQAHEPTELRIILANPSNLALTRYAQFYVSDFGIGQALQPLHAQRIAFNLPPYGEGTAAFTYVPPNASHQCFYVDIFAAPDAPEPIASFQHNVIFQTHPNPNSSTSLSVFVPIRNPHQTPAVYFLSLAASPGSPAWSYNNAYSRTINPGEIQVLRIDLTYTGSGLLPPDGIEIFTLSAFADQQPQGEVKIVFGPPLRFHMHPAPYFAEPEISVDPYPVPPNAPVEICAEVRNVTDQPTQGLVRFFTAPFGIGVDYHAISQPVEIFIPELGMQRPCVYWVPPAGGQYAFKVLVETPDLPMQVSSQRVVDVNEILLPGSISQLTFTVRNPTATAGTISLGLHPMISDWSFELSQDVLLNMQSGDVRSVTLTVQPSQGVDMPPDLTPVVDVEAFLGSESIGGFRKIYRSPVPVHRPADPIYAEREIMIRPYPPQDHEPTEICVEVRNPTPADVNLALDFNWAEFGIGLPWHQFHIIDPATIPANGLVTYCTMWVPPHGGRFGFEVGLQLSGHERIYSQRVIDVGEILLPNQSTQFEFIVSNPYDYPIAVSLAAKRYLPQWEVTFAPDVLQLGVGGTAQVVMTVIPVQQPGDPEPSEGQPVIDVEAYWTSDGQQNQLLGGFRKLFFPPVPIHQPGDPPYAEGEINISPYPPQAGEPTRLSFEARNPTAESQPITVTFEVGNLGIGLPFNPISSRTITLPPFQTGLVEVFWVPPFAGEFCVRVKVEAPFFNQPFYSSRNISIVRLPEPYGAPEVFQIAVGDNGNPSRPLVIQLGLNTYLPDWQVSLNKNEIILAPGQNIGVVVLTLTPPADPHLLPKDGRPVADVAAFVNGELIGGIRKVWRPPVPLGQLGEPGYAESEITINPDPPVAGQPATFSAQVRNNSPYTRHLTIEFGWANFGMGIPFSNVGVIPTQINLTLTPNQVATVSAQWTPQSSGNYCVLVILRDVETGSELRSQRNVHVTKISTTQCETITQTFELCNNTDQPVTVTIGSNAINLPPGWMYTVTPDQVVLSPHQCVTVTLVITPPCGQNDPRQQQSAAAGAFGSNSTAKIQVEGYDQQGKLLGGIEVQVTLPKSFYLPVVRR